MGSTLGIGFGGKEASLPRSTCMPTNAKAARRIAPRRAMVNEVFRPLSPEVPTGSPVDDTVNANEAVEAVL